MTTHKQMNDVADRMAKALQKLTEGLAKDGMALEGFVDAIAVQHEWAGIKMKRAMERMMRRAGVVENFAHEPTKGADTEALNKHDVMESVCPNCGDTGRGKPTLGEPDGEECYCIKGQTAP